MSSSSSCLPLLRLLGSEELDVYGVEWCDRQTV